MAWVAGLTGNFNNIEIGSLVRVTMRVQTVINEYYARIALQESIEGKIASSNWPTNTLL